MALYKYSRYNKVDTIDITAEEDDKQNVYELPQTTVQEFDIDDWEWHVVTGDATFESIADEFYEEFGGASLWWVLAVCNDHIFYPLDIQAGDRIRIPAPQWIEKFLEEQDDWESTWRNVSRE